MSEEQPDTESVCFLIVDGKLAVKRKLTAAELTLETLQQQLTESPYRDWAIDQQALQQFIAVCKKDSGECQTIIASRRDAEFQITIAEDAMSASLTLLPAQGGQALTANIINQALRADGAIHGINQDAINQALVAGQCQACLIAEGEAVQAGVAGSWQVLYDESPVNNQATDQRAKLKLRDLAHLIGVKKGEPLLRRIGAQFGFAANQIVVLED